jgi:hypothetical protein
VTIWKQTTQLAPAQGNQWKSLRKLISDIVNNNVHQLLSNSFSITILSQPSQGQQEGPRHVRTWFQGTWDSMVTARVDVLFGSLTRLFCFAFSLRPRR